MFEVVGPPRNGKLIVEHRQYVVFKNDFGMT